MLASLLNDVSFLDLSFLLSLCLMDLLKLFQESVDPIHLGRPELFQLDRRLPHMVLDFKREQLVPIDRLLVHLLFENLSTLEFLPATKRVSCRLLIRS